MKELIFRILTSIALLTILYLSYIYNAFFYSILIILLVLSINEYSSLITKTKKKNNLKFLYIVLGLFYILFVLLFLFFKLNEMKDIIFYFIVICICTDIGGLVFGKIFKGKKLIKISPKKTYSGLYGGFIASFICMFVFYNYLNLNPLILFIFTFSVCLLSQLGDLFFSYLKRKAKVKDTGNLLPGHGGVLDRIDGIIISVPINIIIYTI